MNTRDIFFVVYNHTQIQIFTIPLPCSHCTMNASPFHLPVSSLQISFAEEKEKEEEKEEEGET